MISLRTINIFFLKRWYVKYSSQEMDSFGKKAILLMEFYKNIAIIQDVVWKSTRQRSILSVISIFYYYFFPFEINIRNISHGIEIVPIRLRDPTCSRTARFRLPGTKILDVFTEGSLIKLNRRTNRIEAWQFRIRLFAKIIERNAYLWFIQWNL